MPVKSLASFLLLVATAAGQVRQQQPSVLNPDGSMKFQQVPHGPAADGFRFLYTLPLPQRQYRGTVDGFAAALPAFMQRAATVAGFADRDYSKQIAFIIDTVKTCGQIMPQMAVESVCYSGGIRSDRSRRRAPESTWNAAAPTRQKRPDFCRKRAAHVRPRLPGSLLGSE